MPVAELTAGTRARRGGLADAPDAVLVKRLHGSDDRAFEAIFKRHYAPLLSYCRHMLGSQDEGEDALQQAFIKAHRALLGGTVPRELRPWLYAIARNCCLSAIAARRPTAPLEDRAPALAGLSEQVHQREDLRELVAAIGGLPEDQRSALLLAELDDLSHQAIATIVGCPVSRVKALVYQARSALIADRQARNASCQDIREQLSVAHGGELRRGPLRRHLKLCAGCRDFQLAVSAQRQSLASVLPVLPSASLAAAILGHGAHAVGAASILAPTGGTGVGATAAGSTATAATAGSTVTGATGIAASGTAATAAVSVSAGAGGGTSLGALVGAGMVTKLAVGATIVALAAAGAVTAHSHEAHATVHPARLQLASAGVTGRRISATDIAGSSSPAPGSPAALVAGTGPAGAPDTGPSAQLSGLGGAEPLLITGAHSPSPVLSGTPGQPAGTPGQPAGTPGQPAGTPGQPAGTTGPSKGNQKRRQSNARAKHRRAALERRRLRRARLRRHRLAARRARLRKALRHHRRPATPRPPKTAAAPVQVPVRPHRKAHPTSASSTTGASATPTTGSAHHGAGGQHAHTRAGSGPTSTGTSTNTGSGTGTASTGTGKPGSGKASGSRTGRTGGGSGSTSGKTRAGGQTETSDSGSAAAENTTGAGGATEPSAATTGASSTSGTGETHSPSTARHPKKHLVEEGQLPNL